MDTLRQDLLYTARSLRRNPGFALVVVLTLTIGIGALTAIFSVVNAVLLSPLPFREPARIVQVWSGRSGPAHGPTSPANFLDWRASTKSFEAVTAEDFGWFNLSGASSSTPPERLQGALVSADFFRVIGVSPMLGRGFVADDDRQGSRVVVLGHSLWTQRFAADPRIVDQSITMNGERYRVLGVMPPGFDFPGPLVSARVALWVPLAWGPNDIQRGMRSVGISARLKPGVTVAQARQDVNAVAAQLAAQYPRENGGVTMSVVPLRDEMVGASERLLLVLLGAVSLVLLIACANVANLMLARAQGRHQEIALRAALGAGRTRILRQLLTESTVLALLGGALGTLVAVWFIDVLLALDPNGLPRTAEVAVDGRVLLFALGISTLTGLLFGSVPALSLANAGLGDSLRQAGRAHTGGRDRRHLRSGIVVVEIAMALVLLVGAGLLLRSFERLMRVDPGFTADHVLTARVTLADNAYATPEKQTRFVSEGLARLITLPGVTDAAVVDYLPFSHSDATLAMTIEGRASASKAEEPSAHYRAATGDYFSAMRIPVLAGRPFSPADRVGAPLVAIVNATFARKYWPGEEVSAVLGRRVRLGGSGDGASPWRTVVGVVGDVKHWSLGEESAPELYVSFDQAPSPQHNFVVRTTANASALTMPARQALLAVDRDQPVEIQPMTALLSASVAQPRFRSVLLGAFAAIALMLAIVGIYGVISYGVTQRTREIGVRLALGAQQVNVVGLILREGMLLTALGIGLGLAGALWLARLLRGMLFQVTATDAVTFVGVSVLLACTALLANYLPARRAAKVDPLIAMRAE